MSIKKTKVVSKSWGSETVVTFESGSVVRIYASKAKLTVDIAQLSENESADSRLIRWVAGHPGRTFSANGGSLRVHEKMAADLIRWFEGQKINEC